MPVIFFHRNHESTEYTVLVHTGVLYMGKIQNEFMILVPYTRKLSYFSNVMPLLLKKKLFLIQLSPVVE